MATVEIDQNFVQHVARFNAVESLIPQGVVRIANRQVRLEGFFLHQVQPVVIGRHRMPFLSLNHTGGRATIYHIHATGAKTALITSQKQHHTRHFLGIAVPLQRNARGIGRFDLLHRGIAPGTGAAHLFNRTHHARFNWRRVHGIDSNAIGRAL